MTYASSSSSVTKKGGEDLPKEQLSLHRARSAHNHPRPLHLANDVMVPKWARASQAISQVIANYVLGADVTIPVQLRTRRHYQLWHLKDLVDCAKQYQAHYHVPIEKAKDPLLPS